MKEQTKVGWFEERIKAALAGQRAQRAGLPMSDNPHPTGTLRQAWATGFLIAEEEQQSHFKTCPGCGRTWSKETEGNRCAVCNLPLI